MLREQTERPVTITHGTNWLAPWPLAESGILGAFEAAVARGRVTPVSVVPEGWERAGGRPNE
jgi:hypothetical protein